MFLISNVASAIEGALKDLTVHRTTQHKCYKVVHSVAMPILVMHLIGRYFMYYYHYYY